MLTKTIAIVLGVSLLASIPVSASVSTNSTQTSSSHIQVAGRYIVKLKQGVRANDFVGKQSASFAGNNNNIKHTYTLEGFQGFAGSLSQETAEKLKKDPSVEYVQPQTIVRISASQKNPPSWGLPRVSQRRLDLSLPYEYPDTAGSGVDAWIIDTGIQPSHTDFGGRAKMAKSFVDGEDAVDLHGHGTHVAGTIGSKTYGVAKSVNVFGVKVLDSSGSGTDADVIAGIQYVAQNGRPGKSVVNMSLGGGKSTALDNAVAAAVSKGVAFIVAAGNESDDACSGSPSGASSAFAVGASDKTDKAAYFSNYGQCVKVYGPGVDITSLWKGKNGATNTISGTSMASPHVAGIAALYLATGQYSKPADLYKALLDRATPNVIKSVPSGTTKNLVYSLTS